MITDLTDILVSGSFRSVGVCTPVRVCVADVSRVAYRSEAVDYDALAARCSSLYQLCTGKKYFPGANGFTARINGAAISRSESRPSGSGVVLKMWSM